MKIVSLHQMFEPGDDDPNDLIEEEASLAEIAPPHNRLDRYPGQGFLERLRLAHRGVAEKESSD